MNDSRFPRKIMIQTSSYCNGRCGFCPYHLVKHHLPHGRMSDVLFQKILDDILLNQEPLDTIMPYLMNEPLLDQGLIDKVNVMKKRFPDTNVHFLTNGLLLDDKMSERIIHSGLDWIGVSFFGILKESYERSMGLPYDVAKSRVDRFIKKAVSKRGSDFVMITFFKWGSINDEEKEKAFAHWKSLGVTRISYYEKGISRAGNVKAIVHPVIDTMNVCHSIWSDEMMHILYNGDVILCCMDWNRTHVLGNINNSGISEIWNSKEYHEMRMVIHGKKPLMKHHLCKFCEFAGNSHADQNEAGK